jgi:hypothetical protein
VLALFFSTGSTGDRVKTLLWKSVRSLRNRVDSIARILSCQQSYLQATIRSEAAERARVENCWTDISSRGFPNGQSWVDEISGRMCDHATLAMGRTTHAYVDLPVGVNSAYAYKQRLLGFDAVTGKTP